MDTYIKEEKTSFNGYALMMIIIGALSGTNAVYSFVVGSTPIYTEQLIAVIFLFITLFMHKGVLYNVKIYITRDLFYLYLCIIGSVIPVLIFNISNLYQWMVGVMYTSLFAIIIILIVELKEYIDYLYIGIGISIILNFGFTLYAFYMYRNGVIWSLSEVFPQTQIAQHVLSNAFRARGLFREQGHLMRYMAVFFLPIVSHFSMRNEKWVGWLLGILMIIMIALSGSATIAVFIGGIVIYLILSMRRNAPKVIISIAAFLLAVFLIMSFIGSRNDFINQLVTAFTYGFYSIFTTSGSNGERLQGMQYCLRVIKDYPVIGCGWNNVTKLFMKYGFYGQNNVLGSYSAGLSLIAELGVFSAFYFYFVISKSIRLLKSVNNKENVALGVSFLMYLALFFLTDYSIDSGVSILLGLVLIRYQEVY